MAGPKAHALDAFDIEIAAHQKRHIGDFAEGFLSELQGMFIGRIGDDALSTGRWIGSQIVLDRAALQTVVVISEATTRRLVSRNGCTMAPLPAAGSHKRCGRWRPSSAIRLAMASAQVQYGSRSSRRSS